MLVPWGAMGKCLNEPRGSWARLGVAVAAGAALALSSVYPASAGATEPTPVVFAPAIPVVSIQPDGPVTPKSVVPSERGNVRSALPTEDFLRSSDTAGGEALADLEKSPEAIQGRCADDSGVSVCLHRRSAAEQVPDVQQPSREPVPRSTGALIGMAPVVSAAVVTQTLGHQSQVCTGDGSDGYRVQPVYAYTGAAPDPVAVQAITEALSNVDLAFSRSAARTGGSRKVRWVTDNGGSGCRVVLRTARITTGATDFAALMTDLETQGAIPVVGAGTTKHLVWTEGEILQPSSPGGPRTGTCGLGESYDDDRPLATSQPNSNLHGTRAAIDDRCWDINGGGSVPAHELMHTLGAVQTSAPNHANGGHCNDGYDLMCYGPGMFYRCTSAADGALFDCGNDDYFNTDPNVGQYLCNHWNTSDSSYLQGWDTAQPPRAVLGLTATASPGEIRVSHSGTASCYGASSYRVEIAGVRTLDTSFLSVSVDVPVGRHTVTVTPRSPYGDLFGTPVSVVVTVQQPKPTPDPVPPPTPNRVPMGGMVLSLTDGRGYGMLAWAIDPDTGGPTRMRVVIPGVVNSEYDWNYQWTDMPARTGWNRQESLVFLTRLPPGTHQVCFDARDANTGVWNRLECRTHSVK